MSPRFPNTRWSLVVAGADRGAAGSGAALAELYSSYWSPLYCFVRRRGYGEEEARDLTQGFFVRLLERDVLHDARAERGRFRTFLLAALRHYLANEWDRARAVKRGGNLEPLPLDGAILESGYRELRDDLTPEELYERRWSLAVIEEALSRLRRETSTRGAVARFERLKEYLIGGAPEGKYSRAAEDLGITEGAVKVAVHRLRRRFGEHVRAVIADTVVDPEEVEEELRHLLRVVSRPV